MPDLFLILASRRPRSGVSYFRLVKVNKLTIRVSIESRWTKLHNEQVHIAIFEQMSQLRIHEAESLVARIPCHLHEKHEVPPFPVTL